MLKIKFWRIENVVLMKVLEQGEEIKRGCGEFFRTDYLGLVSMYNPGILINKLLVRGKDEEDDNMVISWVSKIAKKQNSTSKGQPKQSTHTINLL